MVELQLIRWSIRWMLSIHHPSISEEIVNGMSRQSVMVLPLLH